MIAIEQVDHLGIRVTDRDRAIAFYARFGFRPHRLGGDDEVAILRNSSGVEVNLILNGTPFQGGENVLMDVSQRYPGYTHVALRVASIADTVRRLQALQIPLSGGPVDFGDGHLSVFVRDPDRNVIELRSRDHESLPEADYAPE